MFKSGETEETNVIQLPILGQQRRGFLLALSSPSGAGKTTLTHRLIQDDPSLCVSISCTTRLPRPLEKDGKDYHFLSEDVFLKKQKDGEFLENAHVYGHYYGTPRPFIEECLSKGRDILLDVDWQGVQKIRKIMPKDLVSIFIFPPSFNALEERLRSRAQDSEDVIQSRMKKAFQEMEHWQEYNYAIVNDDLDTSVKIIQNIIQSERLKVKRFEQRSH